jgi:Gly-Xaa carboxypeptidase
MPSLFAIVSQLTILLSAIGIAIYYPTAFNLSPLYNGVELCPSTDYTELKNHDKTQYILNDKKFRNMAVERLSRGIQIDTTIDETMTDFSKFERFHKYLESEFPLVYKRALVSKINNYGLVFEFLGENSNLKPLLLMAHQDTVPIGEISTWEHDPLGGYYDDEFIYGRGTNDVKGLLVGIMSAMNEILIDDPNHVFQRSVIFGFGFDEEISGNHGAKHIGEYLLKKYGPNSIDHILDEGAPMCVDFKGKKFGFVVTAEKGYMDLVIEVNSPGGHSSNPTDTSAIGVLSRIIHDYESDKFKAILPNENPMLNLLECVAEKTNGSLITTILAKLARVNELAKKILLSKLSKLQLFEYTVKTSQAVDVISGGDKYNSLPRNATTVINHRITIGNDFNTIWEKAIKHAKPAAIDAKMGLIVNNITLIEPTSIGVVKIYSIVQNDMPVSPITPAYDDKWNILTSYIRTFYEKEVYPELLSEIPYIIAPATMQGNTDTKHYWKLTDHIYRTQPGKTNLFEAHMHGDNEYLHIDSHLQVIGFYYNYILGIC